MMVQDNKQSAAATQHAITAEPTTQDTPWTLPAGPYSQQHNLCKKMVDAFAEADYDRAQVLARLLLLQGNLLFRTYAHLILAYDIDHGHSHAEQAVQEAESAIQTLEDKDGQVAKLLALAKRTLVFIESQDAITKEEDGLSDIAEEEEDGQEIKDVKEVEVKETPTETTGQRSGRRSTNPVALDNNKFGIASWDFQALKSRKSADP